MAVGILSAVLASGCSSQSHPATTSITVFASSAMIKSLTAIGKQFEAENPGTSVEFIFASSSDLSAELADGNDADVFVSGDYDNMSAVANAGLIASTPLPIAANSLVIATNPGNHGNLASLADLARPDVRAAVCGGPGACGAATRQLEDRTGVRLHPQNIDTTGTDVLRDITSKKGRCWFGVQDRRAERRGQRLVVRFSRGCRRDGDVMDCADEGFRSGRTCDEVHTGRHRRNRPKDLRR